MNKSPEVTDHNRHNIRRYVLSAALAAGSLIAYSQLSDSDSGTVRSDQEPRPTSEQTSTTKPELIIIDDYDLLDRSDSGTSTSSTIEQP